MSSSAARVLIVDPSSLAREGIRKCLQAGGFVVLGEAEQATDAIALMRSQPPALAIVGATFTEDEGLALCRVIHNTFPAVKLILITQFHDDPLFQVDAVASGVDVLMRRRATHEECWILIERMMAGHLVFSREIVAAAIQPIGLSEREREVLKLWVEEKTDREIAKQLTISMYTARTHARNILRKLKVKERHAAVRWARRRGLI